MFKIVRELFINKAFATFLIIGVLNTIVGLIITFSCYNFIHLDYWTSTAVDYILTSIMSYCLNLRYTFKVKRATVGSAVRFALNIVVCYIIAFSLARPCTRWILVMMDLNLSITLIENIAMLVGTGLFVIVNYLGQRFFAFRKGIKSEM